MICLIVIGGNKYQRNLACVSVNWFAKFLMPNTERISIEIRIQNLRDSWGWVAQMIDPPEGFNVYRMAIDKRQTTRQFIQTVMHEMLHIRQDETGIWQGDGEHEAESVEVLADAIWLSGLI